jgi:DNA-binding XRE family transcriptional regulator
VLEINELVAQVHRIILDYRKENRIGTNEFAESAGLKSTALVNIEAQKILDSGKIQTIKIDTLLKLFIKYPVIGERFCDLVLALPEKKHTAAIKSDEPTIEETISIAKMKLELAELMRWKETIEGRVVTLEKRAS